jgi:hypothetical protein
MAGLLPAEPGVLQAGTDPTLTSADAEKAHLLERVRELALLGREEVVLLEHRTA